MEPAAGEPLRILLVEDNDGDAELARRTLGRCGEPRLQVARAPTLAAALPHTAIAEVALLFAAFPSNALTGQSLVVSHGWFMQ